MATGSYSAARRVPNGDTDFEINYGAKASEDDTFLGSRARLRLRTTYGAPKHDNRLIQGDNLRILRALVGDPSVSGNVRLIYIDPPYATGFRFQSETVGVAYDDGDRGSLYLESFRQRLVLLRKLLSTDGTIYVHLDSNMIFPVKLLMDEVFGQDTFRNMITRVKCNPKNQARLHYGDVCDYLLFYSASAKYLWNDPVIPWNSVDGEKEYNCVEPETGRRFKKVPCHLPGVRYGATGSDWNGRPPPPGKHWVHSPEKLNEMDKLGRIYWSATGNPRRKLYLDEASGKRRNNLWTDFRDTQNQNARVTGYPTEKNYEMLRMIVEVSSNPDDLVLDAYAGSGTTLAAAGSLGRRWIGIDSSPAAIRTAIERLRHGTPLMGSYAQKSYIRRMPNKALPDADVAFQVWFDEEEIELCRETEDAIKDPESV